MTLGKVVRVLGTLWISSKIRFLKNFYYSGGGDFREKIEGGHIRGTLNMKGVKVIQKFK